MPQPSQPQPSQPQPSQVARAILQDHGPTFAEELDIDLVQNTPMAPYQWLAFSLLASAPISQDLAVAAFRALIDAGWTTAEHLAGSTWDQRRRALNESGYARYDEKTSTMLGALADRLLQEYGGDLRRLREAADGDLGELHRHLEGFEGIGSVGAGIFLREVQLPWTELRPYADPASLEAADRAGLPRDAAKLADLVGEERLHALLAGLIRVERNDAWDQLVA